MTKEFVRGLPIIKNISFTIREGGTFGLLGKSGHGKSIIMQSIRGILEYEPTYGQIIFRLSYCPNCHWVEYPSKKEEPCPKCSTTMEFREVDYWEELKKQTRLSLTLHDRIAIMPQRGFSLYSEFPAIENVRRILISVGYPEGEIDMRAAELISHVKLDHRLLHLGRDLSGGEKQRVIFSMCLARNPLLFLADEPTGTLDPITSEVVHEVIREAVNRDHITLVITSHWPEAIKALSEEAALLENGELTVMGKSEDVYNAFMEKVEKVQVERYRGTNPIMECEGVKKWYYTFDRGLVKAVDGVDLKIYEGEIFGIVGLSGSGKTTLAHMMMGIKPTTTGKILVKRGEEWFDMSIPGPDERGMIASKMDILHQEYTLHAGRIILENLVGAVEEPLPEEQKTKKAYEVLRGVNFTDKEIEYLLYKYPDQISEGERHRVCIARSLMKEPKIVLLDEPTGTADPITRVEIARSIRNARDALGQTYLIISHDIDFIRIACDRAAYMRNGKIETIGDPEDVVNIMVETEKKALISTGF
ncbi:MAG: putative ABC transporter ATP-binding protein [Candidatus Bathyarchaeota archaeon BA2]|nr:MAG: putative ABC transporter ATP-binding protein [Candidatus Bathyarchaeota archaeon BA2]